MRWAALVLTGAVMLASSWLSPERRPPTKRQWLRVVFGLDGQTADWAGQASVDHGSVCDIAEWGLEASDSIDRAMLSWSVKSGLDWQGHQVGKSFAEPERGLLLCVQSANSNAVVHLYTRQGDFELSPSRLTPGRPTMLLNRRVSVEALASEALAADTTTHDDFPAIAVDSRGATWVAWVAFDESATVDRLYCRCVDDPNSAPQAVAPGGEFASVRLLSGEGSKLLAVWCAPDATGNWDIYVATRTDRDWSSPKRLTSAPGPDIHLAAAQSFDGSIWLAWQSFRNGDADIFIKRLSGVDSSDDVVVADSTASQWEPSIAIDANGDAWVAYDTYEHGSYDVYLVRVQCSTAGLTPGRRLPIATSEEFEAHANVLAEPSGNVWVAFDNAGPNWGKDYSRGETVRNGNYAEPLHAARRLGLRCVKDGRVHDATDSLPQRTGPRRVKSIEHGYLGNQTRFYEYPQLALDKANRLWLFFRLNRQGYPGHPQKGGVWEVFATTYTASGWLEPILLPHSAGRQDQRVSVVSGQSGQLVAAWSDGNHHVDRKYTVHWGQLPNVAEKPSRPNLKPMPTAKPHVDFARPGLTQPSLKQRNNAYHLYFGDLHRHTDISLCTPTIDGCLTDAYRYAIDAAQLDFLAVTDHTRDTDPYPWWRIQKAADLYHIPGRFVPIYAYERSNSIPGGGHRNVFFLERGCEVNYADYLKRPSRWPSADPDVALYPWLKERGRAFTVAHTPGFARGRNRGTWTFNDPQVEPVAEIFQAYRRSYERPDPNRPSDKVESVPSEASLWYALAQGYRLGFIASSDHHSTHLSYACVWATEKTRHAIFEAISARRTYAATDRIVLDFRVNDAIMGQETPLKRSDASLCIRANGTAPFDEIEVIRSGKVIAVLRPNQSSIDFSYVDKSPLPGRSYYYVRLHQQDGNFAWSSPIWVTR